MTNTAGITVACEQQIFTIDSLLVLLQGIVLMLNQLHVAVAYLYRACTSKYAVDICDIVTVFNHSSWVHRAHV